MWVVGAAIGACLLALAGGTTSFASAGKRAEATHPALQLHTYTTPGTLPLRTSLLDPFTFTGADQATAFKLAQAAGASYIRFIVPWSEVAPATRPADFDPTDPASQYYTWGWLDGSVSAIEANGLTPILDITTPPSWALAHPGSGSATAPSASALGNFATALALRYDGLHGEPPVHIFQVWNEPNLSMDLNPVNANTYRGMVNAVANAVHAVDRANLVVAGGLEPFGHKKSKKQSWYSAAPLAYMRSLLCLSKGTHPHATCHTPVHFDVWAHHPYSYGGPFGRAKNPDDVELGDLPRMRSLLQAGIRLHHVVSTHSVQFWVTEFGWDSNPPRRHGVPLALEARWTAEALYQMWRSGVSLGTWFLLQDQRYPSVYQSGLYFHARLLQDAQPKPMRTAFRFPFVAYLDRQTVHIWGRDATSNKQLVTIQQRHGARGGWRAVARVRTNGWGIFSATLRLKAAKTDWVRATAPGSGYSLAFSLTVPKSTGYSPFGR